MRRLIAVALLLVSAGLAAEKGDPWLRLTSDHFELLTTGREGDGRDLLTHFEKVRAFFIQAMGNGAEASRPVRIMAFRTSQEFDRYRFNKVAIAYYHGGASHEYIVMKFATPDLYPVAVHEYLHLLVRQAGMEPPVWFNEGLAENSIRA